MKKVIVLSFVVMAMFSCKKEVATLSAEQSHIADSMALVKSDSFYVPYVQIIGFSTPMTGEWFKYKLKNCKSGVVLIRTSNGRGWTLFELTADPNSNTSYLYFWCDSFQYKFKVELADGTFYETQVKEYSWHL